MNFLVDKVRNCYCCGLVSCDVKKVDPSTFPSSNYPLSFLPFLLDKCEPRHRHISVQFRIRWFIQPSLSFSLYSFAMANFIGSVAILWTFVTQRRSTWLLIERQHTRAPPSGCDICNGRSVGEVRSLCHESINYSLCIMHCTC